LLKYIYINSGKDPPWLVEKFIDDQIGKTCLLQYFSVCFVSLYLSICG